MGAFGTVLGTAVAYSLIGPQLGPEGWKVAAALCGSYIGGSLNFAAVSQALALAPGPLLAGAMTADNCIMALYIAAIMSIPAEGSSELPAAGAPAAAEGGGGGGSSTSGSTTTSSAQQPAPEAASTAESMALSLAAAAVACTLGNQLAAAAGFGSSGLAVMALLASGIAMLGSRLSTWAASRRSSGSSSDEAQQHQQQSKQQAAAPFVGAEALGGALMMLFFATIGAAAGSLRSLQGCGWLLLFILLQLRCGGWGMGCCVNARG